MCAPSIPDTSGAQLASIQAQTDISNKEMALQQKAFDYLKDRQTGVDQVADQVTQRQLDIAQTTADQGTDLYNYQKQVFRPVEESMVAQAMQESTPAYYEQYAQKAVATQANAQANAQDQTDRALAGLGVNPNSGQYVSNQRGLQVSNAAQLGATANNARDQADALAWAHKADVAGIGKGLVGAGNASYGLATGANTAATNATDQATRTAAGNLGTPTQYAQLGITAGNNAVTAYNDIYRTQTAAAQQGDPLMGALGGALGMFAGSTNGSQFIADHL